jgi:hypothetical protein
VADERAALHPPEPVQLVACRRLMTRVLAREDEGPGLVMLAPFERLRAQAMINLY